MTPARSCPPKLGVDDQVPDGPGFVVHEDVLDVSDLSVFRLDRVAHDRGRRLEANVTSGPGPASTMPAIRWTSFKDFMFDYDRSDIRYSESRKPAEIAPT